MGEGRASGISGRQGLGTVRWGKPVGGVFPVALLDISIVHERQFDYAS
jgi:hypothetical protein